MSDRDLTQSIPADDGWGDAANEGAGRMIKGQILKFSDWRWTSGKEAAPVENGTRLVALATSAAWIRWENKKPVETRIRRPGERMPEREELGHDNEDAWEEGLSGEQIDPWRNTRFVYLVDPDTAEAFTFSTSSWGGRDAVIALGDQIGRMRTVHLDATPIVELRALEMPTKFGKKSKPLFKVVGWKTANSEGVENVKPAPSERVLPTQEVKRVERQILDREIDDDIPF